MLFAGTGWVYSDIVLEIALHHNPKLVLKALRLFGKHKMLPIVILIAAFGTGIVVMDLIQKHASKKEIDEAMQIVSLLKKGES